MTVFFWSILIVMTVIAAVFVMIPLRFIYKQAALVTIGFIVVSLVFYLHWGASKQLSHYWALKDRSRRVKLEMAKYKNPQQIIARLKTHLARVPDSAEGWYLLGQIYLTMQNYTKSVAALEKAYQLDNHRINTAVTYAQALFFNNNRQLTPFAKQLLKSVLKRSPKNIDAINLLAINAYNLGDYQEAIEYWERLLPLFEPGSKDSKILLAMIAKAEKRLKE